jgi:hypothetical protein
MSDEWGPWIEHDGAHIPTEFVVGDVVQLLAENNQTGTLSVSAPRQVQPEDFVRHNWFWGEGTHDVLRYRIRKPRGLTILEGLLETLPEQVDG